MTLPGRLVLLGHPVAHSLSPAFQDAALRAAGIPLRYEALDVPSDALPGSLSALITVNAAGNVTVPHKEFVFARCDAVSPLAQRVAAVNTFRVLNGRLIGDNTDVGGFNAAVRRAFGEPREGLRVAVLGAGGGSAAVLAALEGWPAATAVIVSRSGTRAAALAARFGHFATVAANPSDALRGAGMVVNATPVGLSGGAYPVDPQSLDPRTILFDLSYRRGSTPWVRQARALGMAAEDGLGMLVEQGALSFELWFGIQPDRVAMWGAIA